MRLHSKINISIEKAGISFKRRKFMPHVSIARFTRQPGSRFQDYIEGNDQDIKTELFANQWDNTLVTNLTIS